MSNILTRRTLVAAAPAAIVAATAPALAGARGVLAGFGENHPDAELLALRPTFERLHAEWQDLVGRADAIAPPTEIYSNGVLGSAEIKRIEKECGFLDALDNAEAKVRELDAVATRMRALPARTLQGFAVKARLAQFDANLSWSDKMQGPEADWDWDVQCMDQFVREIERAAGLTVEGGLNA